MQCKYERLADFCFLCGLVTHTERFCRKKVEKNVQEGGRDWGGWLRAPPRRAAGQDRSKWLRDERDVDWGNNFGEDNYYQKSSGFQTAGVTKESYQNRIFRDNRQPLATISGVNKGCDNSNLNILRQSANFSIGPTEDELDGLNIEDRKRRRSGPQQEDLMPMDRNVDSTILDAALSTVDCATSPSNILATLAQQASRGL